MLDVTKTCFYILECRWQQGEEAEAVAWVPMFTYYGSAHTNSERDNACLHATSSASTSTTATTTTTCSCEGQAWGIHEGKTSSVYSLCRPYGGRWLAACYGETIEHSIVQWSGKGVVRFRTAAGSSSDLVGVLSSCSSQPCSRYHLAGIL